MVQSVFSQRPLSRISPLISQLKALWHFYPEHSLAELVNEVVLAANLIDSDFPPSSYSDIEDVAYPEGHYLHQPRSIEMGISILNEKHKQQPSPPTPFQTSTLKKFEEVWRKNHQMRLGQLLLIQNMLSKPEEENTKNPLN